jgi:hypothetical protein
MATLAEQLDAMLRLERNWDGYGADPIQSGTVALAKLLVEYFSLLEKERRVDRHIRVHPTRVGGVLIEWEDDRYEHELEVYPDGRLELLHENKATGEMEERRFDPGACVIDPVALESLRHAVAA